MTSRKPVFVAILLALCAPGLAIAGPQGSPGRQGKLDKAIRQNLKSGVSVQQVIVRAVPGQEATVRNLLSSTAKLVAEHPLIGAYTAEMDAATLQELVASDSVAGASLDAVVQALGHTAGASKSALPYTLRATLGLDDGSVTGDGVGVAIIDSGIVNDRAFGGRIARFYDFTRGRATRETKAYDDYGTPTTCSATGRFSANPHGNTSAGSPARFPAWMIARNPGSPGGVPRAGPPRSSG